MTGPILKSFKIPVLHILLIVILSVIAYSNTHDVPFLFDDTKNIAANPIIKNLRHFIHPSEAKPYTGSFVHVQFVKRFVGYFTFALNYRIHGIDVRGYHAFNLFIHILTSILLYILVILTFRTPFMESSRLRDKARHVAFFSALLFVSHPVQTQAVTYIVQRFASLATLFYILSLVLYIKARLSNRTGVNLLYFGLCIISAVLGMKTKEIAFTLPLSITLYEFMFFNGKAKRRLLYLIPLFLTMLVIPLTYVSLYSDMDKPLEEIMADAEQATTAQRTPRIDYLLTELRVIVTYLRLLVLPVGQNLDYDYPIYSSFFTPPVYLSFLFLLGVFGLGAFLYYRSSFSDRALRLVSFGIFWFFITISVESSVFPLLPIYEHRVYLPSAGVFAATAAGVFLLAYRLRGMWMKTAGVVLVAIVIVLNGAAYARNTVWQSNISLWEDVVRKSPNKARPHTNLGEAYEEQDMVDKAIEHYQIALRAEPNTAIIYNNLGNAYRTKGMKRKAIEYFERAINLKPNIVEPHINLGILYKTAGQFDRAIHHYKRAISLNPNQPDAHYNIGNIYMFKGLTDIAIEHYRHAISLRPEDSDTHNNLGIAYQQKGMLNEAEKEFSIAKKLQRSQ
jgi:tetratricopeptide (TPR) repeat protein